MVRVGRGDRRRFCSSPKLSGLSDFSIFLFEFRVQQERESGLFATETLSPWTLGPQAVRADAAQIQGFGNSTSKQKFNSSQQAPTLDSHGEAAANP